MKNMKIGRRLGLGFGVVVALMVTIVIISLGSLSQMNQSIERIINDNNVKIDAVFSLRDAQRRISIGVRDLVLVTDEAGISAADTRISKAEEAYTAAEAVLQNKIATETGKSLLGAIKEAKKAAMTSFEQVRKYARSNENEAALQSLNEKVVPTVVIWQNSIDSLNDYQTTINHGEKDIAASAFEGAYRLALGLGIASTLIAAITAWLVTRSITRPLNEAVKIAKTVAAGDLSSTIISTSTDETGQLLQSLRLMNDNLQEIVGKVRSGTDTIATASSEIAAGNLDLSSRTEQQASALEETASSMEELTTTVKQNADNARHANKLAEGASAVAKQGGEVVSRVIDTMNSIDESSKRIVDIISVIDGIAFQTNILALNAAVEAARAGEQGRGFAVVASEVRNLAQRSAAAAKEIKGLISDSVQKVSMGSALVTEAGVTIERVVQSVRQVTDIMAEISTASIEQEQGIGQINEAITEMDTVTQQNAALVEEAAAAAQSLQEQSTLLVEVVSVFKLLDDNIERVAVDTATKLRISKVVPKLTHHAVERKSEIYRSSSKKPVSAEWEGF
jgi:methyl-accepting chemotaxis protein